MGYDSPIRIWDIYAFCGLTSKSVLARNYTDYNPERLQRVYERANLKVLDYMGFASVS
jgi:hypothetical protein